MISQNELLQRSIEQDAARILFILRFCGMPLPPQLPFSDNTQDYFVYRIDSETKLQKLDFWIRYPDYLCLALLLACSQEYVKTDVFKQQVKHNVRSIIENEEPQLRLKPMLKYLRGAYEPLDTIISFLYSRGLVLPIFQKTLTCYDLTRRGDIAVSGLLQECPETHWYKERCELITHFFGALSGIELRQLQYEEMEYKSANMSELITSIDTEKVEHRFKQVFGESL
jgi:hypothetical protein